MRRMSCAMDLPLPRIWGRNWDSFVACPSARLSTPLLHRRIVRRTHVHFVHPIPFVYLCYERSGLFPILWKRRVGMKRVPILFRFFLAGMSHDVDEGVGPGRIIVGYPVADDTE